MVARLAHLLSGFLFRIVVTGISITGCGVDDLIPTGGISGDPGEGSQRFVVGSPDGATKKMDIVFVVDTSSSMTQELTNLEGVLADFLGRFINSQTNVDWQLFLIVGKNDNDIQFPVGVTTHPKVEHLDPNTDHPNYLRGVDSHNGLGIGLDFLSGYFDPKKISLRPDAVKEMVFVTDDDANTSDPRGVVAATFDRYLKDHPPIGQVIVNGILGIPGVSIDCGIANFGDEYISLAQMPSYSGSLYNLCSPDWNDLFQKLATSILDRSLIRRFVLTQMPEGATITRVLVGNRELSPADYHFEASSKTVFIGADYPLRVGDLVEVFFQV